MKSKTFTRITKVLLLAVLFMFVGVRGWGQVVAYDLTANNAATAGIATNYPGQGRVMNVSGITSSGFSGTNGQTCYGWNVVGTDSWVTSAFSTAGYINLSGSYQMKANTNIGPRDFKVQYSLNGSSWTDTPTGSTVLLTNSLATYNFTLPSTCDNKSTVYVRWVQNSTYQLNGTTPIGTTGTYNASLKGVSIAGDPFAAPSTQASNISIISITPTTIKIGCTNGNGNNRIIKINTTNTFTSPTDDYFPVANSNYPGSGEQVIYNGTGSSITVTVPSTTNVYWFRVYEFNKMDNLTRYKTETASVNPKQCKLETIHTPTFTNIRLINSTLGATINTPTTGTITERGIFWSTTSPVDETANLVPESSTQGGVFTLSDVAVERGSTIYFKGYVTNESGTIMSEESSFTNSPIFTGTGTWETAARWNVQEVPGTNGDPAYGSIEDNPIIDGTCTLTADNNVTNLTINASRVLNINPDVSLSVDGSLSNNGGTAGLKLLSTAEGTGSLMHNTANVNATVQRYISGTSNDLTAKAYHLVSVPINSATYLSGVWLDSYLFTYLEGSNTWFNWDDPTGNVLNTPEGAMVYYSFGSSKTYSVTGQLNNGTYSPTVAYSGVGFGYNLVPNPYPSPIDWNAASGWTKTNISGTIWGFNPTSKSYGSWNGATGTENVTNIIPVGQAFFVVATGAPTLTLNNDVRLHDTKDFLKSGETVPDVLHIIAAGNEGQNEIAIQFADDATINGNDNLDAIKFYSDMTVPQFSSFTSSDPSLLTINAIPYSEESAIVPLRFDMDFTGEITFTASGMESFENNSSIKLEDKQLAQLVDLRKNPVYTFNHAPTDSPERFALHFGGVLGLENPVTENLSTITVSGSTIYLNYPASNTSIYATLFDVQGRLIKRMQLSNAGQDNFSISTDGIYILKLSLPSGTETHKIVVR